MNPVWARRWRSPWIIRQHIGISSSLLTQQAMPSFVTLLPISESVVPWIFCIKFFLFSSSHICTSSWFSGVLSNHITFIEQLTVHRTLTYANLHLSYPTLWLIARESLVTRRMPIKWHGCKCCLSPDSKPTALHSWASYEKIGVMYRPVGEKCAIRADCLSPTEAEDLKKNVLNVDKHSRFVAVSPLRNTEFS